MSVKLQTDEEFSPGNCACEVYGEKNSDKHQIFEHQNIKNIKFQTSKIATLCL